MTRFVHHPQALKVSLRAKVALGVALPILAMLFVLVMMSYRNEQRLLEEQIRLTAFELSATMKGSLRHAMLVNDREMIANIVNDVGGMETIDQVQIVDLLGRVKVTSYQEDSRVFRRVEKTDCEACHQIQADTRPETISLTRSGGQVRVATLLPNEPDCARCHLQPDSPLGLLLIDVSLNKFSKQLRNHFWGDLMTVMGITLLVALLVYYLIHLLVVRPVESFSRPLAEFVAGNFTPRLPVPESTRDELGQLALAFNHMADELDRHVREQEERHLVRQSAISEERERIARDLHDGLAQLLGYVNTKAMAVRLLLKKRHIETAESHLQQLEEAAQELSADVRAAIHNLKLAGRNGAGLAATLHEFADRFSQRSEIPVVLSIAPEVEALTLTADVEKQLLFIVQESLTNVRKHASASRAAIDLRINNRVLDVTVSDDGDGFVLGQNGNGHRPQFGLEIMRERAEAIDATFSLQTSPGNGTSTHLRLPLKEV